MDEGASLSKRNSNVAVLVLPTLSVAVKVIVKVPDPESPESMA